MDPSIEHCIRMIAAEERRAISARSKDLTDMHYEVATLFRAELDRLRRLARYHRRH